MAGTWEVTITPINISTKEVSVSATRTDGEDVRTYIVPLAPINTAGEKLAVMDEIWAKFQADIAKDTQISNVIGTLEADAKANLEARET